VFGLFLRLAKRYFGIILKNHFNCRLSRGSSSACPEECITRSVIQLQGSACVVQFESFQQRSPIPLMRDRDLVQLYDNGTDFLSAMPYLWAEAAIR
jgi:hypothetical protein